MKKNLYDQAVYAAYVDNDYDLLHSTSGGVATGLSRMIIRKGGYVAGVAYTSDFRGAEYIFTNDMADLEKMQGSKYIEVYNNGIIDRVKNQLKDSKVLFIGLPCMVAALKKKCGNHTNLYTCALVCHGPIHPKVQSDYVEYLEQHYESRVTNFTVRHKIEKWIPPYIRVVFENGKEHIEPFYESTYNYAFGILGREACYDCKFKGNNAMADLVIGDFWGAVPEDEFYNEKGVSVVFVKSPKGEKMLEEVENIKLFSSTYERAVEKNPMVVKSKDKHPKRELFSQLLMQYDLFTAIEKSFTPIEKLKRVVKRILLHR